MKAKDIKPTIGTNVRSESETKQRVFLCPTCNKIHTVWTTVTNIYSKEINNAYGGVIPNFEFLCPNCHSLAFEVDIDIANTIRYLRRHRVPTFTCCAGHVHGGMADRYRDEDQIWVVNGTDKYGNISDDADCYPGCMIGFDFHEDEALYLALKMTYSDDYVKRFYEERGITTRARRNVLQALFPHILLKWNEEFKSVFVYSVYQSNDWWEKSDEEKENILNELRIELRHYMEICIESYRRLKIQMRNKKRRKVSDGEEES